MERKPIDRWMAPIRRFMAIEASSGLVLLAATVLAVGLANSSLAGEYFSFWHTKLKLAFGEFSFTGELGHLIINDVLMTIFFFVVGLEIKREMVHGELSDLRSALLPILAALGGMVMPALVYLVFQYGKEGEKGWAIPMATDIAFVVGVLALFGNRIPIGFKIFLLSLAIVDDLASILVIAFVFSQSLSTSWLVIAVLGCVFVCFLNWVGVRHVGIYTVVGIALWICVFNSGIHPTIAGVALGLLTPANAWLDSNRLFGIVDGFYTVDRRDETRPDIDHRTLRELRFTAVESISPLERLENTLHPWVAFVIMPLFALANAGIALNLNAMSHPVAIAVGLGLVVGKPLGILLFSYAAVRSGVTKLPAGVTWTMLASGACLAGIGFTMSLFINTLSFPSSETLLEAGKFGIFMGSIVSGVLGVILLLLSLRSIGKPETMLAGTGSSSIN